MTGRIVEHSTNNGRTWQTCKPYSTRSPLAAVLAGLDPYEVHDDGLGNLYRWRPAEEAS